MALIVLYHERWEEELPIDELKTQRERPVLRSQTPGGVVQELYGLLLGHYVIRVLIQEAAATRGIDPRRLSFTATLKILRCRLPECPKSERGLHRWYHDLIAEVAEEVLEKRRNRINPRVIKRKMSNWKKEVVHRNYPQPNKELKRGDRQVPLNGIGTKGTTVQRVYTESLRSAWGLPQLHTRSGGYDDRHRQGGRRIRVLAHS